MRQIDGRYDAIENTRGAARRRQIFGAVDEFVAYYPFGNSCVESGQRLRPMGAARVGSSSCQVEHVGMVVSGRAVAAMDDGRIIEMEHSWVLGEEPYVSLHSVEATTTRIDRAQALSTIFQARWKLTYNLFYTSDSAHRRSS